MNPIDELAAVLHQVTGRQPDRDEVLSVLVESAVGDDGWLLADPPSARAA